MKCHVFNPLRAWIKQLFFFFFFFFFFYSHVNVLCINRYRDGCREPARKPTGSVLPSPLSRDTRCKTLMDKEPTVNRGPPSVRQWYWINNRRNCKLFLKIALPNQGRSSSPLLPSIQSGIHITSPKHTAVLTASIPCAGPDVTSHSQKEESRQELLALATKENQKQMSL